MAPKPRIPVLSRKWAGCSFESGSGVSSYKSRAGWIGLGWGVGWSRDLRLPRPLQSGAKTIDAS